MTANKHLDFGGNLTHTLHPDPEFSESGCFFVVGVISHSLSNAKVSDFEE
jgi:hypothetical protein